MCGQDDTVPPSPRPQDPMRIHDFKQRADHTTIGAARLMNREYGITNG
jgi:hypothetical protein